MSTDHTAPRPTKRPRTEERPDCAVCQETQRNPFLLLCGHRFHKSCLQRWAARTCPLCRAPYHVTRGDREVEPLVEVEVAGAEDGVTMPPAPSSDDWSDVEDWVEEYERRGNGSYMDGWRAWRIATNACPLAIPSYTPPPEGRGSRDTIAGHVAHHIARWISSNQHSISRRAARDDSHEYVFDDAEHGTVAAVFREQGVEPPSSVVLALDHYKDMIGSMQLTFEHARRLEFYFSTTITSIYCGGGSIFSAPQGAAC